MHHSQYKCPDFLHLIFVKYGYFSVRCFRKEFDKDDFFWKVWLNILFNFDSKYGRWLTYIFGTLKTCRNLAAHCCEW